MTLIPHNHREFEVFRLIFQRAPEKAPAAVQATETTKKPEPLSRDQAWEKIEARHGKESYESMIKTYLDKLLPKRLPKYKSALRNSSVDRYVKRLGEIRKEFWRESAEITEAKEQAKESIKAGISEELDVLRSGVEGARKRTKISNRIPEAKEQAKVQSYFNDYMEALNGRYFNVDVAFGKIAPQSVTPLVPVSRERIQAQQYKKKARDFQGRLSEWVNNKLDWLYETGEPNAKDLAAFRKEIGQRYYFLSTVADKNPDVITMADMEAVERMGAPMNAKEAKKNLELIAHDESGLASQMHLEAYHLMQPEEWEDRSRTLANSVAIDAKHNGLEDEFVSAVSTYIESSSSFDQAAGNFEAKVAETSKAGIVETHAILKKVND
ncbi:MAG: hypothetical protein OEY44_02610, partial [Candidatus Peregrinibacteria bacterium]|nr:hypothetical protein [Candidatus Peregrinibacteria bacterium]